MKKENIRNVAIIAHVDHGKTTLVDKLFKISGMFRENQDVEERLMDSMDLEKERGITIKSKNGACDYKDYRINIIDTPGHADFGGEVERVLGMAEGAVFLVDAAEGPMPQSHFVLKKAIAKNLPIIVVVNKIDKQNARPDWAVDQVFDLMAKLGADDETMDFPVIYAVARNGMAKLSLDDPDGDMTLIFDEIIKTVPESPGSVDAPFQFMVSSIDYSPFLGRLAIGKISSGKVDINQAVAIYHGDEDKSPRKGRISKVFEYRANTHVERDYGAICGDIVALAGVEDVRVGETLTNIENPAPLPWAPVDPPTISMTFMANDSPFAGREGDFVTSPQVKERLERELLTDVALQVEDAEGLGFKVSGRGELHLSILIEKMRREGYEFQVSRPQVIIKVENGQKTEPYETVTIEVPEAHMGGIIESLGTRKGQLVEMVQENGLARLNYKIPTRGILGYISEFMTQSKGMGVMYSNFDSYGPYVGELKTRKNGVIIANEICTTVAFALDNLQNRGTLFMGAGVDVYEGQIIGESARNEDMVVNPAKSKKLTNMRSSGADDSIVLTPHKQMSLEQYLAFIEDDELLEATPKSIRIRKKYLKENERKRGR